MPIQIKLEIIKQYRDQVFLRFERAEDCGKQVLNGERRCLHHVISPLDFNVTTHEQDFFNGINPKRTERSDNQPDRGVDENNFYNLHSDSTGKDNVWVRPIQGFCTYLLYNF